MCVTVTRQSNPSVKNQKIFDSSLYTREPWKLPRQLNKLEFGKLFSIGYVGATISRPRAADCRPYNTNQTNLNRSNSYLTHQSLPCVRGGGQNL